jgi:hypothetical protein
VSNPFFTTRLGPTVCVQPVWVQLFVYNAFVANCSFHPVCLQRACLQTCSLQNLVVSNLFGPNLSFRTVLCSRLYQPGHSNPVVLLPVCLLTCLGQTVYSNAFVSNLFIPTCLVRSGFRLQPGCVEPFYSPFVFNCLFTTRLGPTCLSLTVHLNPFVSKSVWAKLFMSNRSLSPFVPTGSFNPVVFQPVWAKLFTPTPLSLTCSFQPVRSNLVVYNFCSDLFVSTCSFTTRLGPTIRLQRAWVQLFVYNTFESNYSFTTCLCLPVRLQLVCLQLFAPKPGCLQHVWARLFIPNRSL